MLVTDVGDNFKMLMAVLAILVAKIHYRHQLKVTNITMTYLNRPLPTLQRTKMPKTLPQALNYKVQLSHF